MNLDAYRAVRSDPNGAGVGFRQRAWISLSGRDRASFLNGQVSNDIVHLLDGQGVPACLLNNVGHMMANLTVHAVGEELLVETAQSRAQTVIQTLERFVVRERVAIADVTPTRETLTVQGKNAAAIVAHALAADVPVEAHLPLSNALVTLSGGQTALLIWRARLSSSGGFDLVVPTGEADRLLKLLLATPGALPLDSETMHVLRVEAGMPAWGAELDESIIPLEASLHAAIDRNKGCYMGQEVIARILSRGHTNRTLVGFRLTGSVSPSATLWAQGGEDSKQAAGRITSAADSPEVGPIALGYARNEHSQLGTKLFTEDGIVATVTALPFVIDRPKACHPNRKNGPAAWSDS